ncbi:VOC family protein [Desemzia sp. RIT804]|uniref:VOC family protein n=1 Tax=Desemzia sp. RIT 804 TaxID=2810209 RepID=UPI001950A9C4|nr:VOC family protein [Desemzia sp. RIT 804]MBM6614753.1 VOC family protein [Desemzia sp. RIT 804]
MHNIHGIDHVGITVPDIEQATQFFIEALAAEVLYDTFTKNEPKRDSTETQVRLGIPSNTAQRAIRMLKLPNGPGLELFEYEKPHQSGPVDPADIGWTHIAIYVENIYKVLKQVEIAGGKRQADPQPLGGIEKGANNLFCYVKTPWGSTIELISYPSPQPYQSITNKRKWQV